jgi:hypothetical protein
VLPRGKQKARSHSLMIQAVQLNDAGYSNIQISEKLGKSTRTIERLLGRFVETDPKYGVAPDASDVLRKRSEALHRLDEYERPLLLSLSSMSAPTNLAEEIAVAECRTHAIGALCKLAEQRAKLCGTYAPVAKDSITNNTVALMNGVSQEEGLKTLIAYKALQAQNARS